ncbi:lysylphosphatidylglycerol synthase transmembrane domain-containing protein [Streptomyces sp.]|uniref:lysylphosphatidylglycerol synthase transmembrane domain-containing protein n=1 Tax=Streptomyces sp. TaxID=1931 RepID=UPI002D77EBC6|nr:lysylphosphatidylglycerol synthase transmembrane domain-containing protein [Streptomyces sp.]HET6359220.1 lysylphosphatidylglycerol synthase transmembrane domain-containing protein [Streptomyces sp.]
MPETLPLQRHPLNRLRQLPVRRILCFVPFVLVAVWVVGNWPLVASGVSRLGGADVSWLLMGGVVTGLCWVAASCVRQGTVVERLPTGRLLASQFAAGAANHLLPAGLGAHVVTLRFLRGCGIPLGRSTAALALYSLVEAVARIGLLLGLVLAFPDALRLDELVPPGSTVPTALLVAVAVIGAAVIVLLSIPRLRRFVAGFLRTALTDARALHKRPSRALALWGGALAFPLLQAGVLVCVALALELPVSWHYIVIAYLAASIAAGFIPAPGGIGSVEPALAVALVTVGAPLVVATATVLGFRFLTVWMPLLPGVAVLAALVRWRVL